MTKERLQELAEELAGLDKEKDSARIRTLENEIADYEHGLLKNIKGKAYFPLLKIRNGQIPFEEFYSIFADVLMEVLRGYKPEKAKFTTALSYRLNLRVNDYFKELKKAQNVITLTDLSSENSNGEDSKFEIEDDSYEKYFILEEESEFDFYLRIALLIAIRKAQEKHLNKSKRSYFEGFFTFDTVKLIINNEVLDADGLVKENDTLFPIMEIIVLEYMLYGSFRTMLDIAENELRDSKLLNQRNETMQACYKLSKPTVVGRNKLYMQFWTAAHD